MTGLRRKMMDYEELVSRNWGFLSVEDQLKLKKTRILLAGCGLGSNVATLAARTGFGRFVLADGDRVEISNLNRQAFRLEHVGRNKAEVTAELIGEINPRAEIKTIPHFITEDDVPALVEEAGLIVNTVDPGPVIFALNQAAQSQKKIALFPLNIGFSGVALAFTSDSVTLEEILGSEVTKEEFFIRLIQKVVPHLPHLSSYLDKFSDTIDDILKGSRPGPQLGVAAYITASLVVTAMVRGVLGIPLKLAPEPLSLDAWLCSQ